MAKRPLTLGGGNDPTLTSVEKGLLNQILFRHPSDSTQDILLAYDDGKTVIEVIQDPYGSPSVIGEIPGGGGGVSVSSPNTWTALQTITGGLYVNGAARWKADDLTAGGTIGAGVFTSAVAGASGITLPATPDEGRALLIREATGAACTINRNGNLIDLAAANLTLPANKSVLLVYSENYAGWLSFFLESPAYVDPWTNVVLGSDFTTSSTGNTAVTGMNFTPAASTRYLIEVSLLLRTNTATVGPRPGFSWPTGSTDGGAWMQAPNSATANAFRNWGPLTTQNAASTGVPDTTNSHLAIGGALLIMGGSPSGAFGITLASETGGTTVTMKAGSLLRYRAY
jgi:hypothetical protein